MRANRKIEGYEAVRVMQEARRKEELEAKLPPTDVTWWEWLALQHIDPVVALIIILAAAYTWVVWK